MSKIDEFYDDISRMISDYGDLLDQKNREEQLKWREERKHKESQEYITKGLAEWRNSETLDKETYNPLNRRYWNV